MSDDYTIVDTGKIIEQFPSNAETILIDAYLSDKQHASIRVFRLYDRLAPHYHKQCDELLYLVSGRVICKIGDEEPKELSAGNCIIFARDIVHALEPLPGEPVVFVTADTPRRDPKDVHFVDPKDAEGKAFTRHLDGYGPND